MALESSQRDWISAIHPGNCAFLRITGLPIDALTDRPFAGNLAAVYLLEQKANADWMHAVAAKMSLSETTFVRAPADGFGLRWFTC